MASTGGLQNAPTHALTQANNAPATTNNSKAYFVRLTHFASYTPLGDGVMVDNPIASLDEAVVIPSNATKKDVYALLFERIRVRSPASRQPGVLNGILALRGQGREVTLIDEASWVAGKRLLDESGGGLVLSMAWVMLPVGWEGQVVLG